MIKAEDIFHETSLSTPEGRATAEAIIESFNNVFGDDVPVEVARTIIEAANKVIDDAIAEATPEREYQQKECDCSSLHSLEDVLTEASAKATADAEASAPTAHTAPNSIFRTVTTLIDKGTIEKNFYMDMPSKDDALWLADEIAHARGENRMQSFAIKPEAGDEVRFFCRLGNGGKPKIVDFLAPDCESVEEIGFVPVLRAKADFTALGHFDFIEYNNRTYAPLDDCSFIYTGHRPIALPMKISDLF